MNEAPTGNRRVWFLLGGAAVIALGYLLRGVLLPLFLAFLVAYALDPAVDRLERLRIPRSVAAPLVLLALVAALLCLAVFGVPYMVHEFREASTRLPDQFAALHARVAVFFAETLHAPLPANLLEALTRYGNTLKDNAPDISTVGVAVFGTVSAIFVLLGSLVIPVFALYLLGDFDRIVARGASLIPRRWEASVTGIVGEIHGTLGRYVRGQILTNLILAALYAVGLEIVGVRLAIPIGILTGMLSFIPYVGLGLGAFLALLMAMLEWRSAGQVIGVCIVMGTVGVLDSLVITPRIVGGSVGLKPLEVLLTMMAAGTLFGFLGVLIAVPLGAVLKILLTHAADAYTASSFYRDGGAAPPPEASAPPRPTEASYVAGEARSRG